MIIEVPPLFLSLRAAHAVAGDRNRRVAPRMPLGHPATVRAWIRREILKRNVRGDEALDSYAEEEEAISRSEESLFPRQTQLS